MKRSKTLTLALMSATALSLAACDDSTEVAVFETIEQCASQDGFDAKACETNMQMARDQHIQVAPKYSSVADCESDFGAGQCETAPQSTTSGGSIFMPLMMGYMMGNMLSGRSNVATQPLYRSRDDAKNFRTADNHKVAGNTGISKVAGQAARAPSVKTSTVRRGGFGATARASTGGVSRSFGS